ncbi:MAG: KUP/HAK/KT family potassium transporter [Chitinophagales bacterium]|nr:KUP/HAK/KT family potassium transporter [Hyphomicrobiales bacterium]
MSVAATQSNQPEREALSRAGIIGALGIVYGDIGTSPLYAFRESIRTVAVDGVVPVGPVLGILSLIFWSLILIVTIKYVVIVLKATNEGEGGIMALTGLAAEALPEGRWRAMALTIGLIGVALFYGDCILTPAISVLSAVEGLKVATPAFEPYVVPIAVGMLAALFVVQSRGTARIGNVFGPIVAMWFAVLAISGIYQIAQWPDVLAALNPLYAINFLSTLGVDSLVTLGAVFLALTGAEALYADVGHFNRRVIRFDWFAFVLPALALNYFGQGALVLRDPAAAASPFFLQFHEMLLYPMVALAAAATVIASQAVITGAFTLSQQAMVLRFLPRLEIRFTSRTHAGQIYVPQVNWLLATGVLLLVITFKSSEALAAAYGMAVVTTMVATTLLVAVVAYRYWNWSAAWVASVFGGLLVVDLLFFGANAMKIAEGGWIPVAIGAVLFIMMRTWQQGRSAILARQAAENAPLQAFWDRMNCDALPRVPGVAIYLSSQTDTAPGALVLNVKHNKCLHETVVLVTVVVERVPWVRGKRRIAAKQLERGFHRIELHFGFAETLNVPKQLLKHKEQLGFAFDEEDASYFIGREVPVGSPRPDLAAWQEPIFLFLTKNSGNAADFFCIPPEQVIEIGAQIEV